MSRRRANQAPGQWPGRSNARTFQVSSRRLLPGCFAGITWSSAAARLASWAATSGGGGSVIRSGILGLASHARPAIGAASSAIRVKYLRLWSPGGGVNSAGPVSASRRSTCACRPPQRRYPSRRTFACRGWSRMRGPATSRYRFGCCTDWCTQLATIRTPRHQRFRWSAALWSACRATTPRPAAAATARHDAWYAGCARKGLQQRPDGTEQAGDAPARR